MEVADGQQLGLTLFEPLACGRRLALGAIPAAAAVVRDDRVREALAARDMPTECRRAAARDRTHDFKLVEADMPGIGATPRRSMVAEDIGDLQRWTGHGRRLLKPAAAPFLAFWMSGAARKARRGGLRWQKSCRGPRAYGALWRR